jgi:hypothetical protein
MDRGRPHALGLAQPQGAEFRIADTCGVFQHSSENWLQVALRGADDAQHFGRRRLLFSTVGGAVPQFTEQPRVLDGYHGLIGEGLEQSNLSLSEKLRLGAAQRTVSSRD